jgi:hypothetical protein
MFFLPERKIFFPRKKSTRDGHCQPGYLFHNGVGKHIFNSIVTVPVDRQCGGKAVGGLTVGKVNTEDGDGRMEDGRF